MVLNLAESVSSQSVSLALQALRGDASDMEIHLCPGGTEFATGLMLGLGSGGVVALVGLIWLGNYSSRVVSARRHHGGVVGAAILGLIIPMVLRMLRLEPRVAAGPIGAGGSGCPDNSPVL